MNLVALPRDIQKLHNRKKTNRCKENSLVGIKSHNNSSDSDTSDKEYADESTYQPSPSLSSTIIKENKTLSESSSKSKQCGIIPDSLMCLSVIV